MVKVSITLPNATQITVESEEPELIREVIGMALMELPKELLQAGSEPESGRSNGLAMEKGNSVNGFPAIAKADADESLSADPPDSAIAPAAKRPGASKSANRSRSSPKSNKGSGDTPEPTEPQRSAPSPESAEAFAQFCQQANPVGDMRRVVVAAEGAERFLGIGSVDSTALADLFELAEWRSPQNFTQTLRNAARGKFQWLERVPGRSGRYSVTPAGRSITLGE